MLITGAQLGQQQGARQNHHGHSGQGHHPAASPASGSGTQGGQQRGVLNFNGNKLVSVGHPAVPLMSEKAQAFAALHNEQAAPISAASFMAQPSQPPRKRGRFTGSSTVGLSNVGPSATSGANGRKDKDDKVGVMKDQYGRQGKDEEMGDMEADW